MLFGFFARKSKRRTAEAKRSRADVVRDRIDSANENICVITTSPCATERVIARAPSSAEIATIVDAFESSLDDVDRFRVAIGRCAAANVTRTSPEI